MSKIWVTMVDRSSKGVFGGWTCSTKDDADWPTLHLSSAFGCVFVFHLFFSSLFFSS